MTTNPRGRFSLGMPVIVVTILVVGLVISLRSVVFPSAVERSRSALMELLDERHGSVVKLAEKHLQNFPNDIEGIALAAEAMASQYKHDEAIALYQKLPRDGGEWEFLANYGIAKRHESQARLSQAETHYQAAIKLNPFHSDCNLRFGHILQCTGRVWEAGPIFFNLLLRGKCTGDHLLGMSATDRFFRRDERMEQAGLELNPPEPLIYLSQARRAILDNRNDEAEQLLRQVIAVRPELGEAQGRLGRLLSDKGDPAAFEAWRSQLPKAAIDHPEVLFSLGLQASRVGQTVGAARCFVEALRLSPNHLASNVQLASCLEKLQQSEMSQKFVTRGKLLAQLESGLNLVRSDLSEVIMVGVVKSQRDLGRFWETIGWCYVMRWIDVDQKFPRQTFDEFCGLACYEPAANFSSMRPELELKPDDFAWPDWSAVQQPTETDSGPQADSLAWRLDDVARSVGIDFNYIEGTTEATRLNHIFCTVGGGLGAIDYDRDGWPDLHLAQAHDWTNPSPQPELTDRLYRNSGEKRFADVSYHAGVAEPDFSHGVTVGDYDQDGFPDLYINNKGLNRLYHNCGDGTFEDVTRSSGTAGDPEDWSISSVFADLNGDQAPDLYVLNYAPVTPTAEKLCHRGDGTQSACTPDVLIARPDRFFLNQGDGTFRDATAESGFIDPNGRGLGVIVWKYGTDNRLGLFIANDTTENYLFVNQGNNAAGVPQLQEEAVARGVAFDVDGNAQASMGVAAGDANGDGELELFVTNFYNDSNTYYSRGPDGFFTDLTRPFNLRNASFKMLGFGAQFADINCDGWPDLIATNGHVDQVSSDGTMDRMPPQVFGNQNGRRFEEVPARSLGTFFEGRYLGRGMAIFDWNRDGRTDIGISHLHAPFALLSRQDSWEGAERVPIVIRLIGTRSCRDPVGAVIEVQAGSQKSSSLQTGGSGFVASNDTSHHFFVPAATHTVTVSVQWPDGRRESWDQVPVGCETLLIEENATPHAVRRIAGELPGTSN